MGTTARRMIGLGAVLSALAGAGTAEAKLPTAFPVAGGSIQNPSVFVDSRGTVSAIWSAGNSVRYAHKPAGAKSFTQVALPDMANTFGAPFIYSPAPSVLEIIVNGNGSGPRLVAWGSSNEGASWSRFPTTPLMQAGGDDTVHVSAVGLVAAPGGPIENTGDGPIVQLNATLTKATQIGTDSSGLDSTQIARSPGGTIYLLNGAEDNPTSTLGFVAGSSPGQVAFPCTSANAKRGTSSSLAAGAAQAVVVFSGCGHAWSRTIGPTGAVGPLVVLGGSPGVSGVTSNGDAYAGVVAGPGGALTAAFTVPGNDVQVAHSADGSRWTVGKGLVHDTSGSVPRGTGGRGLATGVPSWLGFGLGNEFKAIPLSATYSPPSAPSGAGLTRPVRGRLGSLSATVPGRIDRKTFSRTARTKVRVVDTFGGVVDVGILVHRSSKAADLEKCSADHRVKLSPGRAKLVTVSCKSGAITIGGPAGSGVSVSKGDMVEFNIIGRVGELTIKSKIA
jgi:hypothetical protein